MDRKSNLEQPQAIRMWTLVIVRVLLLLICFLLVIWILYALSTVILLLVLSVFFCYLVAPIVRLFEQPVYVAGREIKLPRGAAIMLVYALIGVLLFFALQLILPILWQQVTELANNLPDYVATASSSINKTFNDANSWMRHLNLPRQWRDYLMRQFSDLASQLVPWLQAGVFHLLGYLTYLPWLIIIPLLSFFMLKDAERFEDGLVALMPNERLQKRARWLLSDVSRTLAAYIRAQITACLEIGVIVTTGLALIGVPYALVLGVISGLLEFFPLIGPLTAAAITFTLALTFSFKLALWAALFLLVLRIVQDYIIYPRIVGAGVRMHPLLVIIAVFAGAEIGGLSGIFLAIPVVGLFIVGYNHYLAYRGIQSLNTAVASNSVVAAEPEPEISSGPSAPLLK